MQFFPTTDEDFQYFRAQGYTGSINDMHFNAMGDLGYTGALNDRIHAYLVATFGSYHEAMRDLRNGTSVFALSSYIIGSLDPGLVLDFASDYYRTSGTATTLASATTYTGASLSTMTDSDGLVKWSPHNYLTYSEDYGLIGTTDWNNYGGGTPPVAVTMSNGERGFSFSEVAGRSFMDKAISGLTIGAEYTITFWMDAATGSGIVSGITGSIATVSAAAFTESGWYTNTFISAGTSVTYRLGVGNENTSTASVVAGQPHIYRSDLGGMVDNPATASSYVPTTSAAVYLPRVGNHVYNGTAWVNEGLFLESEARTNLVTYSEDFTAGSWPTFRSTITANSVASPDGSTNADTITQATTDTHGGLYDPILSIDGTVYTWSAYLKAGTVNFAALAEVFTTSTARKTWFDLGTGAVGSTYGSHTASIEDVGDGWYRCSIMFTATASSNNQVSIYIADANADTSATIGDSIYVYGAQLEAASTPSSYIPTAGSTVTRAAQTMTVAAADMPTYTTAVSIQMDGQVTYADRGVSEEVTFYQWAASGTAYVQSYLSTVSTRSGDVYFDQRIGALRHNVNGPDAAYSPDINVPFNIAGRHGSTFVNVAIDGTSYTAHLAPTSLADLSAADFDIGETFMGNIGKVRVWADDIGDTGIAEASE